ncbi:MAG: alpha/beta hydrolase-fold protein [Acidobacteria bacterium]|nr:alpha/beta hydrolase-fold protein [Acidobacteriota bacterium]
MLTATHRRTLSTLTLAALAATSVAAQPAPGLQFEVTLDASLPAQPPGRLLVVLAERGTDAGSDPRRLIGRTGRGAAPTFGVDTPALDPGARVVVDAATATIFPFETVVSIPAGDYDVQAVLATNRDLRAPDAPGNVVSDIVSVTLDPARAARVAVTLSRRLPDEALPPDSEFLRFVKLRSELLSTFHGRPIYLRAGIILPVGFDSDLDRRYPLRVRIGGFGDRYTTVQALMGPGSAFRTAWTAQGPDAPRMLLLHLDGAGPFGDPYQVNSANSGPYGDAVTRELIPYVEREFRGIGTPRARVLDGSSTGGWVALALQLGYPDLFNGAWASCPDSVDFRAFQRVDVYDGQNAYVDAHGTEVPSARNRDGSVRFTMRHEVQMENVLGHGGSWTTSGQQWGAWNAAYGPRGADGRPVPLWDPQTGRIDPLVARHWERYDLRLQLEQHWDTLAPKLDGKLNIWVGDMDDYFLDGAVRLFDSFLARRPTFSARVAYGPGHGHCWTGISADEMMQEMAQAVSE